MGFIGGLFYDENHPSFFSFRKTIRKKLNVEKSFTKFYQQTYKVVYYHCVYQLKCSHGLSVYSNLSFSLGKSSDSQNSLEDLSHFGILAHLRKASTSASIWDHLNHNGEADVYRSSRHDDLPPAIWSPGAQQCSPEGAGKLQQS